MAQVVGLGAGGHAKVVIEILKLMGGHELIGLLDAHKEQWLADVLGVPVLGDDSLLPELYDRGIRHAFIGLGTVGDTRSRRELYTRACRHGFEIVAAIHPQSIVSKSAKIGIGPTIMAGAVINASAWLADDVIINTGAIVEHDCIIRSHVHIATGARLSGGVRVGEGSHVGAGAIVRQGINIGTNSIVGAGAVVIKDVPDNVVVTGVPASILKGRGIDV